MDHEERIKVLEAQIEVMQLALFRLDNETHDRTVRLAALEAAREPAPAPAPIAEGEAAILEMNGIDGHMLVGISPAVWKVLNHFRGDRQVAHVRLVIYPHPADSEPAPAPAETVTISRAQWDATQRRVGTFMTMLFELRDIADDDGDQALKHLIDTAIDEQRALATAIAKYGT